MISKRFKDFIKNPIEWGSCVLNLIMCLCMAYFYVGSDYYASLVYSVFFFAYIVFVFLFGEKVIPFLYLIYILFATQNITFINCTGFFIVVSLVFLFPKFRVYLYGFYAIEICLVCFRHEKSALHLLCHFAFCFVFWILAQVVKRKIENDMIEKEKDRIRVEVEAEIYEKIRNELKDEIKSSIKPLNLTSGEENVLSQLAEGKMIKEVEGVSKNTKTDYIEAAMLRNGCRTKAELIAIYSLEERLPELFPSLFPENQDSIP